MLKRFDDSAPLTRAQRAEQRVRRPRRELVCRACGTTITSISERIQIAGSHHHVRTNPCQVTFHFGCFRRAPGCSAASTSTEEHTWFPGYRWQVAICDRCTAHLGWRYSSGGGAFFGLIVGNLAERGDDD
jgi:hypothetical protein